MAEFYREDGSNVFTFPVADPTVAMEALLDTPKLFSIGSVDTEMNLTPFSGVFSVGMQFFDVFVTSGFARSYASGGFTPQLVQGSSGLVGAVYTYKFLTGKHMLQRVSVRTELAKVVDDVDYKRVVYKNQNEAHELMYIGMDCCFSPELPRNDTESRFELSRDGTSWSMKFSFTGPNAARSREREGLCNYWALNGSFALLCLPFLPIIMGHWNRVDLCPREELLEQIKRLQQYCDPQSELAEVQEGIPLAQVSEEEGIPLAQVSEEATGGQELQRFFELYKSGAISQSEYDIAKAKILRDL